MLEWEAPHPPLPERILVAAELILGKRLPESYKALVKAYPGGRPVQDGPEEGWLACVGWLMSLDPRHGESVFDAIGALGDDEQPAPDAVPIIGDGGGNMICLDYGAGTGEPTVVYWQHELFWEEGMVPVAPSFDAFLQILERERASSG